MGDKFFQKSLSFHTPNFQFTKFPIKKCPIFSRDSNLTTSNVHLSIHIKSFWFKSQFAQKVILPKKSFCSKSHFAPKVILVQKSFQSKRRFGPKVILLKKSFWSKSHFGPQVILVQKSFQSKGQFSPKVKSGYYRSLPLPYHLFQNKCLGYQTITRITQ